MKVPDRMEDFDAIPEKGRVPLQRFWDGQWTSMNVLGRHLPFFRYSYRAETFPIIHLKGRIKCTMLTFMTFPQVLHKPLPFPKPSWSADNFPVIYLMEWIIVGCKALQLSSALILRWENHCTCALELPVFICASASIFTRTPNTMRAPNLFVSFLIPFPCLWHSLPHILVHPHTRF